MPRPTPPGVGRLLFWALVVGAGLLGATCSSYAGPAPGGGRPIRIQVANRITISPILPQEILLSADVRTVGSTSVPLDLATGGADTNLRSAPLVAVGIRPEVTRQIIGLWRIRFPPQGPAPPAIVVDYQLTSPLGVPDTLGLTTQPATTVDVVLTDLGSRVTRPGGGGARGPYDIEGDVEFRFQSASLSAAGVYSGELVITVNFL